MLSPAVFASKGKHVSNASYILTIAAKHRPHEASGLRVRLPSYVGDRCIYAFELHRREIDVPHAHSMGFTCTLLTFYVLCHVLLRRVVSHETAFISSFSGRYVAIPVPKRANTSIYPSGPFHLFSDRIIEVCTRFSLTQECSQCAYARIRYDTMNTYDL